MVRRKVKNTSAMGLGPKKMWADCNQIAMMQNVSAGQVRSAYKRLKDEGILEDLLNGNKPAARRMRSMLSNDAGLTGKPVVKEEPPTRSEDCQTIAMWLGVSYEQVDEIYGKLTARQLGFARKQNESTRKTLLRLIDSPDKMASLDVTATVKLIAEAKAWVDMVGGVEKAKALIDAVQRLYPS